MTRLYFVVCHWYRVTIGTELAPSPIGELLAMRYLLVLTNSLSPTSDLYRCIVLMPILQVHLLLRILLFVSLVYVYNKDNCGNLPSMCLTRLYFVDGHWHRVIIGTELAPSPIGELLGMRNLLVLTNSLSPTSDL